MATTLVFSTGELVMVSTYARIVVFFCAFTTPRPFWLMVSAGLEHQGSCYRSGSQLRLRHDGGAGGARTGIRRGRAGDDAGRKRRLRERRRQGWPRLIDRTGSILSGLQQENYVDSPTLCPALSRRHQSWCVASRCCVRGDCCCNRCSAYSRVRPSFFYPSILWGEQGRTCQTANCRSSSLLQQQ